MPIGSSTPRTASVRGVVVFGAAGVLLALVAAGLFFRFLAHRWWPDFVIATTPSVAHLYERLRDDSPSFAAVTSPVLERIVASPRLHRRFVDELLERLQRAESIDDDGSAIVDALQFLTGRIDVSWMPLWHEAVAGLTTSEPDRRLLSTMIVAAWPVDEPFSAEAVPELWRAFQGLDSLPTRMVGTKSVIGAELPDALAVRLAGHADQRIFGWLPHAKGGHHERGTLVEYLYARLQTPRPGDAEAVLALLQQQTAPTWFDTLVAPIVAQSTTMAGCVDLLVSHPHLASTIWRHLAQADTIALQAALTTRWHRLLPLLDAVPCDEMTCPVVTVLGRLHDEPSAQWLRTQIHQGPMVRRKGALTALGVRADRAATPEVYPLLWDDDLMTIAGWTIRRLDAEWARGRLIEELWTDPEPLERLELLAMISDGDPFTRLLADPRWAGIDQRSPLYRDLGLLLSTSGERGRLDAQGAE